LQRGRSILLRITCDYPWTGEDETGASTRPQHFAADHRYKGAHGGRGSGLQRGRSILLRITYYECMNDYLNEMLQRGRSILLRITLMCYANLASSDEPQRGRSILLRITAKDVAALYFLDLASTRPQHFAADHF